MNIFKLASGPNKILLFLEKDKPIHYYFLTSYLMHSSYVPNGGGYFL